MDSLIGWSFRDKTGQLLRSFNWAAIKGFIRRFASWWLRFVRSVWSASTMAWFAFGSNCLIFAQRLNDFVNDGLTLALGLRIQLSTSRSTPAWIFTSSILACSFGLSARICKHFRSIIWVIRNISQRIFAKLGTLSPRDSNSFLSGILHHLGKISLIFHTFFLHWRSTQSLLFIVFSSESPMGSKMWVWGVYRRILQKIFILARLHLIRVKTLSRLIILLGTDLRIEVILALRLVHRNQTLPIFESFSLVAAQVFQRRLV